MATTAITKAGNDIGHALHRRLGTLRLGDHLDDLR
jgi:hypothetical protein